MIVTVLFAPLFHGRVYDLFNDATVVSKSFNQSAGDVGATYNFTVEGTDVNLT